MSRILPLLFAFAIVSAARADDLTSTIKQEAQNCAKALLQAKYDDVVKYTHPKVITMVGGKEKMIAIMESGTAQMKSEGISFESVSIGEPEQARKVGLLVLSKVPQHIVMKIPGGHLLKDSSLLGISEDGGKNWSFLDLGNFTQAQFAQAFPDWGSHVEVPERTKPVFQKDP